MRCSAIRIRRECRPESLLSKQSVSASTSFTARKTPDVRYLRNVFPLLNLGMSRDDCMTFLRERGFGETVKSACIGCPYSGNARMRRIRDAEPEAWVDLVESIAPSATVAHGRSLRETLARSVLRPPFIEAVGSSGPRSVRLRSPPCGGRKRR